MVQNIFCPVNRCGGKNGMTWLALGVHLRHVHHWNNERIARRLTVNEEHQRRIDPLFKGRRDALVRKIIREHRVPPSRVARP
jgi:hypothetical protein